MLKKYDYHTNLVWFYLSITDFNMKKVTFFFQISPRFFFFFLALSVETKVETTVSDLFTDHSNTYIYLN